MVEDQDTLTVKEFKAWLVGMIRGKRGAIPDLDDWKQIKKMLDKVEESKETIIYKEVEKPGPNNPWQTPYNPHPHPPYYVGDPPPNQVPMIWYSDQSVPMSDNKFSVHGGSFTKLETAEGTINSNFTELLALFDDWVNDEK